MYVLKGFTKKARATGNIPATIATRKISEA
jgi:hypothetical protein